MYFNILVISAILSFSVLLYHLISPFTCNFCLVHPFSLLVSSVNMLTPGNQESATAGLNSESVFFFFLDFSKQYHKYMLFLYLIPLQLCSQ